MNYGSEVIKESRKGLRLRARLKLFSRRFQRAVFLWTIAAVLVSFTLLAIALIRFSGSMEGAAKVGSAAGALEALFTALAFALLFQTLRLQQKELSLQRQELRLTRRQLEAQTRVQAQRLKIELAANQPALQFGGFVRIGAGTESIGYGPGSGILYFKLRNEGGVMRGAAATAWYGNGDFARLFPCDQDEDAYLSSLEDLQDLGGRVIPGRCECYLGLPCRLYGDTTLVGMNLSFTAALIVRYVNWLNLPRVSEYELEVRDAGNGSISGVLILVQDLDRYDAARSGLLSSAPMHRPPIAVPEPKPEDRFPKL